MDILEKLQLDVDALVVAVDADKKFFASVLHYVKQLQELVHSPRKETTQEDFLLLAAKIEEFFDKWRPSGVPFYSPPRQTEDADSTVKDINRLVTELAKMETSAFHDLTAQHNPNTEVATQRKKTTTNAPCIFIGHGRSKLWARVKMFLEDDLHIRTVTYESESRVGESIVPVLGKMLDEATFAVLILTAEDETADGELHARQNVIHEAGLFQGRLGFKKAVLLKQDGLEGFTNVDGLQYIPFIGDSIEQTFYELHRVVKREKLI